jgi:hypothetical protein
MPNWCSNHIQVRGSKQAEIQKLIDAFDQQEFCQAVIPVPEDVDSTWDFCVNNWGTKWDVSIMEEADQDEDGLGFSGIFDTAWSPPLGIVQELERQGYEVVLRYYEPGMAFVGKWEAGYDEYYEYSGESSATVRLAIGDDLDDFFGISESLAEYEAEQEDQEELSTWIKEGVEARENV